MTNPDFNPNTPHCGNLLRNYFTKNRIHKAALARIININYGSLLDLEKRSSVQTRILWSLSIALKHNFFADIAQQLPESYSKPSPQEIALQQRIAELEEENKIFAAKLSLAESLLRKS
jgi:hypothetical protein